MAGKAKKPDKCWSLKKTGKSAELLIYGVIDDSAFWGDEVTPKEVDAALKAMGDVDEIIIRINSPGGSTTAGMAMYSMLKRHPAPKTAYIDGIGASMGSIIPLAANKIIMPKGSMVMIHNPMSSMFSATAAQMRQRADLLEKICGEMIGLYSAKTGKSAEEIQALLDAETWWTAEEAVANGYADEIEESLEIAACIRGDVAIINGVEMEWANFMNAPKLPDEPSPEPTPLETTTELTPEKRTPKAPLSLLQKKLDIRRREFNL